MNPAAMDPRSTKGFLQSAGQKPLYTAAQDFTRVAGASNRITQVGRRRTPLPAAPREPAANSDADSVYDRRWALTLLDQAMVRLRKEYEADGKGADFDQLKSFLTVDHADIGYGTIAARLGISEGAARVAVHRLRKRFREVFREQIAQTVSSPAEIDEEVAHLVAALAG